MPGADARLACCEGPMACVFSKAVLAQQARCNLAQRQQLAERTLLSCASPTARTHCGLLAALLHERARFSMRLPPAGRPLMHAQAMRLQCGGLVALREVLQADSSDVHSLVARAQEIHTSLSDLPWSRLVPLVAAWQAQRRYKR